MSFIARLEASDQFNAIDLALVRLLARLDKEAATAVLLAAACRWRNGLGGRLTDHRVCIVPRCLNGDR